MTGDHLREVAHTLFPGWGAQTRLAERLRLNDRTIRRYIDGRREIPGIVEVAVELLLREHNRKNRRAP